MAATTKGKKRVRFTFSDKEVSEVTVAGSFNDWEPKSYRLKPSKGNLSRAIFLPKGTYEYKFCVDGEWKLDPDCEEVVPNVFGTENNVLRVS